MKLACLTVFAALIAAPVLAADGAAFGNPTPVDFSRPFLFDGAKTAPGAGVEAINLRGVGAGRTLVLMNRVRPAEPEAAPAAQNPPAAIQAINPQDVGAGRASVVLNGAETLNPESAPQGASTEQSL